MNEAVRKVGVVIVNLLNYDPNLIKLGREGDDIEDFTIAYIAVDSLGQATRTGSTESYDGEAEQTRHATYWRAPITVSFYGDGAWERAGQFATLINSQAGKEAQRLQGITAHNVSGLTDVKQLAGVQYGERLDVTMTIQYATAHVVDTLRIDEAQIDLSTEQGQEIQP